MRKHSKCICNYCQKEFEKPQSEITRNAKLNRNNYCNCLCSSKMTGNMINFGGKANRIPPINTTVENPYNSYLRLARRRKKEFNLTQEILEKQWELQNGMCVYSKVKLVHYSYKLKSDKIYTASVDRIDSSKGYIEGNVQFVSQAINYMKGTMSHEETLLLCDIIRNS